MKVAALLGLALLIGGVVMAQAPSEMPMAEFWKHYPMPTTTPTELQRSRQSASMVSPMPSSTPTSAGRNQ
jgi:hypothetical protein